MQQRMLHHKMHKPHTAAVTHIPYQATCDGGSYSAAADFAWDAEDAWTYGDQAFFDKAERIREEARALRDEVRVYLHVRVLFSCPSKNN